MPNSRFRRARMATLVVPSLSCLILACAAKNTKTAENPDAAADMSAEDGASEEAGEASEASDPIAELEQLEGRMSELGLSRTVTPDDAPAPAGDGDVGEGGEAEVTYGCDDVCSLKNAMCELEDQICGLAAIHLDDPVYTDACERALDDCEISTKACDECPGA